jgi:hypothetical protein
MKKSFFTSLLTGSVLLLVVSACERDHMAPQVFAGPDQNLPSGQSSTELRGSAVDVDGIIVHYEWTKVSGPASYTLRYPTSRGTMVDDLAEGRYVFQLRATDNDGLTGTDEVLVTVYVPGPWDY